LPLVEKFAGLYLDDPDPGIHGACEWLLRTWGQEERIAKIDEQLKGKPAEKRQWYVNGQGQALAIVRGPIDFQMGSPVTEADREDGPTGRLEQSHAVEISRSFAIAMHEVTLAEFLRFRKDHGYTAQYVSPDGKLDLRCPATVVTWYDAAAYCNWLSAEEKISKDQWCYEPGSKDGKEEYAEGMKPADDYLHRTGYRLPSEAEWEFACRALAATSRYYGQSIDLLPRYAWYTKNSLDRWMLPVGSLLPNDLGLFDMQGNAMEWCEEVVGYYKAGEDIENKGAVRDSELRVLRGGSFSNRPALVRSAYRSRDQPTYRSNYNGFRAARTYP
jgi:formylglycine-generating enzyme required for sulfatase activity